MKKTPVLVGTILFLIFIIANAAYAFFATNIDIDNTLSFEALFDATSPAFTSYTQSDLDLQVYTTDMLSYSASPAKTAQGILKVDTLSTSDTMGILCTYDINLVWESDDYVPSTVLPDHDEEGNSYPYELTIKAGRSTSGDDGYTYSNKNFNEINISDINFTTTDGVKKANLIKGAEIHNQSAENKTITTWTFTLSFYSLPSSQTDLLSKSYKAHLEVSNAVC